MLVDNTDTKIADIGKKIEMDMKSAKESVPPQWNYEDALRKLMKLLECQFFVGEHEKALATFELLESIVNEDSSWTTTRQLLDRVMTVYAEVAAKLPHETTARNICCKLRKIIIDEFVVALKQFVVTPDIGGSKNYFRMLSVFDEAASAALPCVPAGVDAEKLGNHVREGVAAAILEYRMELDNIPDLIARQGRQLVMEGERVMTYGYCPLTAQLLLDAAAHCNYTLYVLESQPLCYGHLLLDALAGSGMDVVLVPDCNLSALMSTITKVVMPCVAVLFNGNLKTLALGGTVATIATIMKKEVYAVAATYQFTLPAVGNNNLSLSPLCVDACPHPDVGYFTQKFDLTQCDHVFRVVTNSANIAPVQAPRQLTELYMPKPEKEEV